MAAMTTALTEFSNNGNSRTSTLSGHTASLPKLLIEKRRVPGGNQSILEYSFKVVESTTDSADVILTSKVSFEAVVRYPINGTASDVTDALAIFRDVIAGDEFGNSVTTQEWLT
jgi:hypothetical protein